MSGNKRKLVKQESDKPDFTVLAHNVYNASSYIDN